MKTFAHYTLELEGAMQALRAIKCHHSIKDHQLHTYQNGQ